MNLLTKLVCTIFALCGCALPAPAQTHLTQYGFALVDCGVDGTLNGPGKTNYLDEVQAFTNIAHMCVVAPTDDIKFRIDTMSAHQVKAVLAVQGLFFQAAPDSTTGSGNRLSLRPDYLVRWNQFVATNSGANVGAIAAIYIADEPAWNGLAPSELQIAVDTVKTTLPATPIMLIEAWPAIAQMTVPTNIDIIGFDHYGVASPNTDAVYLSELAAIKAKRTRIGQKIVIIMDSQWLPVYGDAGFQPAAMAQVATNYYDLARNDQDVTMLMGYTWPGMFDDVSQLGARDLPANVQTEHKRIGQQVTGKH